MTKEGKAGWELQLITKMIKKDPNARIELGNVIEIIKESRDQPRKGAGLDQRVTLNQFTYNRRPQDIMGHGSNGPVYWGRFKGAKAAVKASDEWEEKVLLSLDHPGIVRLLYAEDQVNKRYSYCI